MLVCCVIKLVLWRNLKQGFSLRPLDTGRPDMLVAKVEFNRTCTHESHGEIRRGAAAGRALVPVESDIISTAHFIDARLLLGKIHN